MRVAVVGTLALSLSIVMSSAAVAQSVKLKESGIKGIAKVHTLDPLGTETVEASQPIWVTEICYETGLALNVAGDPLQIGDTSGAPGCKTFDPPAGFPTGTAFTESGGGRASIYYITPH